MLVGMEKGQGPTPPGRCQNGANRWRVSEGEQAGKSN
jgi:hypothetical protein